MDIKRICLWSGPRNVSTALMYSFAQRSDTVVVDEPLYAHYLKISGREHPGNSEIIKSMESDAALIVNNIVDGEYLKPVVFFKQMVHHLLNLDESFLLKTTNIFLIRNPAEIISSFSKVIIDPTMGDIGIKKQYELYKMLSRKSNVACLVDSKEILKSPESVLKKICKAVGIEFDGKMLRWKRGGIPEDGIWAKYWYKNVHNSTGFQKYSKKEINLPNNLIPLAEECRPYYNYLYNESIKAV